MYYFAYGSSMEHNQMSRERCAGALFLGPARLAGFWFVFDGFSPRWKGAMANVVPSPEDEVWGGLFEITEYHLRSLDQYLGCPKIYTRSIFEIERLGMKDKVKSWVYLREPQAAGFPSKGYLAAVLKGARDCILPESYIETAFKPHLPKEKVPSV
jgi:gamma-glutamylcyclotransferase